MNPHGQHIAQHSPEAALSALGSSLQGLGAAEAARRLAEFGPNQVEAASRSSAMGLVAGVGGSSGIGGLAGQGFWGSLDGRFRIGFVELLFPQWASRAKEPA